MSIKSDFKVTSGLDIANGSLKINGSAGTAGQVLISNGDSNAPNWGGELSVEPIGTIKYTSSSPGSNWLKCDGKSYLQSTYPNLFGQLDLIENQKILNFTKLSENPFTSTIQKIASVPNSDIFIVNGTAGGNNIVKYYDGNSWNDLQGATTPPASSMRHYSKTDTKLIVTNGNGYVHFTSDGINWNSSSTNMGTSMTDGVCYIGGKYFVKRNVSPYLYISDDLITWISCSGISLSPEGDLAGNNSGLMSNSRVHDPSPSLVYGNGIWLLKAGYNEYNKLYRSTNGIDWSVVSPGTVTNTHLTDIYYIDNKFLASSSNYYDAGYLRYSEDGISWQDVLPSGLSYPNNYFSGILKLFKIKNMYYILSSNKLYISSDCINWSEYFKDNYIFSNESFLVGNSIVRVDYSDYGLLKFHIFKDGNFKKFQTIITGVDYQTSLLSFLRNQAQGWYYKKFKDFSMISSYNPGYNIFKIYDSLDLKCDVLNLNLQGSGYQHVEIGKTKIISSLSSYSSSGNISISNSRYGYNLDTEFAVPFIDDVNGISAYIKASA